MASKNTRQKDTATTTTTSSRSSSSSTRGRGSMSPTTTTTSRKTTPRPSPRPSPKASPTPSYEDRSPDRDPITGKPVPNYLKHTLSSRHDHTCRYPDDKTKGSPSTATTPSPPGNSTKRTNNGAAPRNERKSASQSISPKSRTLKTPSPSNLTSSINKSTAFGRSMSSKTLRSGGEKSTTTTPLTSSSSMKMKKKQIDKSDQKVDTKVWPKAHSQSAESTKTQLGLQGEEVEKGITESNAGEKHEVMMVEETNVVPGGSPQAMEEEEVDEEHMHQENDDHDDDGEDRDGVDDENKNEGDNGEVDHPVNEEDAMEKVQEEKEQEGKEDEVIVHPVTATDEIASEHREEQKPPSVEDERDNKSAVSSEFEQQSLTSEDQSLASKKEDKVETEQSEVTHEETSKDAGKVIPDDKDAENDADDDGDDDDFDDEEDDDQDDDVEANGEGEAGEDGNSKVAFKQGSTGRLDDGEETSKPKKMRFRKARALTDEEMKERQERRRLRRKEKAEQIDDDEQKQVEESVQLKPGTAKEKKEEVVYNQVIEETASKLQAQSRKNKVRALVGAFETVISYETDAKQRAP